MQLNLINSITIISIFQSIFFALVFFLKKEENKQANKIFSIILLVFACQIIFSLAIDHWSYLSFSKYNKLLYLLYQTAFLLNPMLFFYIKAISNADYSSKIKEIVHFIPFIIITVFVVVLLYGFNIKLKFNYTRFGIIIHTAIYVPVSIAYLKSRRISLKSFFKIRIKNASDFMKFILVCYIMLWLINVQIFAIIKFFTFAQWCAYVSSLYALTVFVIINSIAILVVIKPGIFVIKQKYIRSSLSENAKNTLFNRLLEFMKTRKPYLEPNLSLKELSEMMEVPVKNISQVINEKQNQNFNDFVNTFRIEESLLYLKDKEMQRKTILEILYASGFNSKSSFNLVFKRYTGYTPVEIVKNFFHKK
jgi:AraC-like DNA-binding protein